MDSIAKFSLSLPKVMQYVGFASSILGKKFDNDKVKNIAQFLVKQGTNLDNKYKSTIANILEPFLKDPSKKDQVAKDYIYYLTARHAGSIYGDKDKMTTDPRRSMSNVLGSIDTENILSNAMKIFPQLLKNN